MKLTLLCENGVADAAAHLCRSEWGLSLWLEQAGKKILFDAAHTAVYRENAEALGIPLEDCDLAALSHYHWDHTGGLRFHPFTKKIPLFAHPDLPAKTDDDVRAVIEKDFELRLSAEPVEIAPDLFFLSQIPRITDFETGSYKGDPMLDDTALALRTPSGCVVISGCAHAGICNVCEQARAVTGQRLRSVIGGFHLKKKDKTQVEKTIAYFREQAPESLYPLHCVDFETQCAFHNAFGTEKLSAGDSLIFD